MANMKDEKEILRELGMGNKEAFASLYEMYAPKCQAFVLSFTKDSDFSKDVTHDIFVKVWLKRDVISKLDSFSPYLFRMVKHHIIDQFENNVVKAKFERRQMLTVDDFHNSTEDKIDYDEMQLLIFNAVASMPEKRRKIFIYSRYQNLNNSEIADIMGISIGTVENHITNALKDIREALQPA
jgi:RNA polymerase sigma-70 factor (ECF subfamily)